MSWEPPLHKCTCQVRSSPTVRALRELRTKKLQMNRLSRENVERALGDKTIGEDEVHRVLWHLSDLPLDQRVSCILLPVSPLPNPGGEEAIAKEMSSWTVQITK